jgi:hypothetical protein
MFTQTAPTDQRAGVRPIAFLLQKMGGFSTPVTLKIRPEDLTRNEPSRVNVTQTLGREVQGWVDNFGEGLPSCTISGHTGWRTSAGSGEDGAEAFETLNSLVQHEYHRAKQDAIDAGMDPATVKLLFIDMLDNFTWSVTPTQFVLRRSKSRPLLYQYNIALQAVSTDIDNPLMVLPFSGSIFAGLGALGSVVGEIEGYADDINGWIAEAVAFKDRALSPIGATIATFTDMSARVFGAVNSVIVNGENAISGTANDLIGFASDIAKVGCNINRTVSAIAGIPDHIKASISAVGSAYSEAYCIFKNSLRPRETYQDFSGLYGASNCSSTTGGSPASIYAGVNAFELMQPERGPVMFTSSAQSSMTTLGNADPVLAPIDLREMNRHLNIINSGVTVSE